MCVCVCVLVCTRIYEHAIAVVCQWCLTTVRLSHIKHFIRTFVLRQWFEMRLCVCVGEEKLCQYDHIYYSGDINSTLVLHSSAILKFLPFFVLSGSSINKQKYDLHSSNANAKFIINSKIFLFLFSVAAADSFYRPQKWHKRHQKWDKNRERGAHAINIRARMQIYPKNEELLPVKKMVFLFWYFPVTYKRIISSFALAEHVSSFVGMSSSRCI